MAASASAESMENPTTQSSSICASRTALILGHIYDTALDFNKWRHALAEIREVLGANNVILILRPGTAKSPGLSLVYREDLYDWCRPFAMSAHMPPGMWISGLRSRPPASSNSTRELGSAGRRLA